MTENLKRIRGQIKGRITRLDTYFKRVQDDPTLGNASLKLKRKLFEPTWDDFERVQSEIELQDEDELTSNERESFETAYTDIIVRIDEWLGSTTLPILMNDGNSSVGAQTGAELPVQSNLNSKLDLPRITLPHFNGQSENWLTFYESFKALIHENESLTDLQKFHYLKSCLQAEASNLIKTLSITDDNYQIGYDLLVARYNNKRLIIKTQVNELFNLKPVIKDSAPSLRQLVDTVSTNLKILKNLDLPTDSWDILIIHLITSKLDYVSLREYENSLNNDVPTLQDLTKFLTQRCNLLDSMQVNKTIKFNPLPTSSPKSSNKSFTSSKANVHLATESECTKEACKKCTGSHNTILHETILSRTVSENAGQTVVTAICNKEINDQILLSTAIINVLDSNLVYHKLRILLDVGSTSNFITESAVNKLGLCTQRANINISGINSSTSKVSRTTTITVKSCYNDFQEKISCSVVPEITERLPLQSFNSSKLKVPKKLLLADPNFNVTGCVDILCGAELFWKILCPEQFKLRNSIHLQNTLFGWVVGGKFSTKVYDNKTRVDPINSFNINLHTRVNINKLNANLDKQVVQFWEIENIPHERKKLSSAEWQCEQYFVDNYKIDSDGHFVVKLPFKHKPNLGRSVDIATKRFQHLEKRFNKDKEFKLKYVEAINDYITMGHMSLVPNGVAECYNSQIDHYFLPHYAVCKETSISTKLRVVFDGSQATDNGFSLNDNLLVGATLQQDLFSILVRFRSHKYVIIADIIKMYRQVRVEKEHLKFQRIVWREDPNDKLKVYELTTVPFGLTSAPFLAIRCLQEIAKLETIKNTIACEIILRDFYVDNCLSGANTKAEVVIIREQLINALKKYGFHLSQWASNSPDLLPDDKFNVNKAEQYIINFDKEHSLAKTLGLLWDYQQDLFKYAMKDMSNETTITKRSILSIMSQVFDPLGLVNPVIVNIKLLIQTLWSMKIDWDAPIPRMLQTDWLKFINEIGILNELTIPRKVIRIKNNTRYEIHGFCDASTRAYGATIYIRSTNDRSIHSSRLLCAKSRIAPLKTLSVPRLELCAALLLAQLYDRVMQILNLKIAEAHLWTDSTIVLAWLSAESNVWKVFVANRVSEIQLLTKHAHWHHVCSEQNPADILSRGMQPLELMKSDLWWSGPPWLTSGNEPWQPTEFEPDSQALAERRNNNLNFLNVKQDFDIFDRYSSFNKLLRVTAWCLRFIEIKTNRETDNCNKYLTIAEIENAERVLVKLAQFQSFQDEIQTLQKGNDLKKNSVILALNPFIDKFGILRVGGRLNQGNINYQKKHPAILAKNHPFTKLVIKNEHLKNLHAGSQFILASLREKYWPLAGLNTVKGILKECIICFKYKPSKLTVRMGNLPTNRIEPSRPFASTGLDFAGPFSIKESKFRNKRFIKAYVCIFVCFSTKACHLEMASDLSTTTFLNCLKRFVARRGLPREFYSDNATNFVAADKQLKEIQCNLEQHFKSELLQHYLLDNRIKWKFMPARSPHFGGLHEGVVKSFKIHFRKIIHGINLTIESMTTILCQIESILNSRPMYPVSTDPNDFSVLTPGHFLIGDKLIALPQEPMEGVTKLSHFQHFQKMIQDFWKGWSRNYLCTLQARAKWQRQVSNTIKLNTLVLLRDENLPPQCWHLGRITSIHPGKDGEIRVVGIKTQHGTTTRAVVKVCPLPVEVPDFNPGEIVHAPI